MRLLTPFFAALFIIALANIPAHAAEYKFTTSVDAAGLTISDITVLASEKVMNEKKLYDQIDVETLKAALFKKVSKSLNKKDLMAQTGARLELTIIDLTPNRPTLRAMSKRVGLSFHSFGLGGAEIKARFIAADGTDLGEMHFRWKETRLDEFSQGLTTWYDAKYAFGRFSYRLAKELSASPAS